MRPRLHHTELSFFLRAQHTEVLLEIQLDSQERGFGPKNESGYIHLTRYQLDTCLARWECESDGVSKSISDLQITVSTDIGIGRETPKIYRRTLRASTNEGVKGPAAYVCIRGRGRGRGGLNPVSWRRKARPANPIDVRPHQRAHRTAPHRTVPYRTC